MAVTRCYYCDTDTAQPCGWQRDMDGRVYCGYGCRTMSHMIIAGATGQWPDNPTVEQ